MEWQAARDNWKHLRVPFQMTLAPIFLWGAAVSGARFGWRLAIPFIAFHLFLYTGITAFNSYYDRDEGPIGGLEHPPPIRASLLPLSLGMQLAGLILLFGSGYALAAIYLAFVALGILYSHPRFRWKANALLSAAVVAGGQGGLGFLAGWAAARGNVSGVITTEGLLGILTAACTTLAMYPITQVYQIDEDRARGDMTLAVMLGPGGALRISEIGFGAAALFALLLAIQSFSHLDAAILFCAYSMMILAVDRFRIKYASLSKSEAFGSVLRFSYGTSAAFTLFIFSRLAHW